MSMTGDSVNVPHRNHGLFSDHYLNERLPKHPAWAASADGAEPILARVRQILAAYKPSSNEAQTEQGLIKPVLEALGHAYEVQATLAVPGGQAVKPDYVFFREAEARDSLKGQVLREGEIAGGLAVGDAKYWDRPLDQAIRGGGDPFTNRNPGYQIAFYLRHTGLAWGILTNGRLWRLYHRDSAHRLDCYYEVDLEALATRDGPAAFAYFSHFFGPDAMRGGPLGLDAVLRASTDYAQGIGDRLKEQVYDALWTASEGLLAYGPNGLQPALQPTDATLREVHTNALILLYRLLFVLYAEARGLLPLASNARYRDRYSLDAIKKEIATQSGDAWLARGGTLWPRLRTLFQAIDEGEPQLGVPCFNGGLFSGKDHPRLNEWAMGDEALARTIDRLARVDGAFVDFRDLASQHLGTIYEGLLEYHLRLAPDAPLHGWTTQLVTSKGERKASGSYYTPGFITRFMTERTLGPVVDAALQRAAAAGREAQANAVLALDVLDPAMGSGHFLVEAIDYLAQRLVQADLLPERLRSTDGSVHEPGVERSVTGRGIDELAYWKRRVAQSCVYGVDINPMAVELAKLSIWLNTAAGDRPLSFLDHHLRAGNSLLGTRLTELMGSGGRGAESARAADVPAAKGKRARGAGRAAAAVAAGQLTWLGDDSFRRTVSNAVDGMWLIEENPSSTIEDVREQERLYASLRGQLAARYGTRADVLAAARFGLAVAPDLWTPLLDLAAGRALAAPAAIRSLLDEAKALATEQRFFHWELEFPEVFFDRTGQPLGARGGFAAVLGNPPYVRQEELGPLKPYLADAFRETYSGVADIYVYFYQRGLELLRAGGRMSFIVTNKWLRAGYGQPLRAWLAGQNAVSELIDFGHAPIFQDADVFPCILQLVRQAPDVADAGADAGVTADSGADPTVLITEFPREQLHKTDIGVYVDRHGHRVPRRRFGGDPWILEPQPVVDLMDKIRRTGVPLAEFAGVKPYYGIKTGFNEAFLIDTATKDRLLREDPRSGEIIKPYLRGQDIKRWAPEWAGLWMIFARRGVDIDAYPAIRRHLEEYRERLEPKPAGWSGGQWAGRKAGVYAWHEIQDSVAYWELFERPKLIYQVIQFYPAYGFDDHGYLTNDKGFFLPTQDLYVLGLLNTPLLWWHNWRYLGHMKDEALNPAGVRMETLPIAPPTPAIRAETEPAVERLVAITRENQAARAALLDWLRTELGVAAPGQKLEDFAALSSDAFVAEVKRRQPKAAGLTPAGLKRLRDVYSDMAPPVQARQAEAARLERRVAELVNQAYGLTADEVALMWRTAPPRMPAAAGPGAEGAGAVAAGLGE